MTESLWYLDWNFWTMAVAFIALVLSQLPPIHKLFKKTRLEIEPYDRLTLTHTMGNPNVTLYLALENTGGKNIKIQNINLHFTHADGDSFTVPGQNYFPSLESQNSVIMPHFRMKTEETWAHPVVFFKFFNREDEKLYRILVSNLKSDIEAKRLLAEDDNQLIEADLSNVHPIVDFYNAKNKWRAGEYSVTLEVKAEPAEASISKMFRFTLFETDENLLKGYLDQYKFGVGIFYFDHNQQPAVNVTLIQS